MTKPKIVDNIFDNICDRPVKWWQPTYWWITRTVGDIHYWFRRHYERIRYGFPFCEAWGFREACAEWVIPRLKHLRENLHGYPHDLTLEEWEGILDQIIWAFEHQDDHVPPIYSDDYDHRYEVTENPNGTTTYRPLNKTGTVDYTPMEKHYERVQEGLNLFAKYYLSLWD